MGVVEDMIRRINKVRLGRVWNVSFKENGFQLLGIGDLWGCYF